MEDNIQLYFETNEGNLLSDKLSKIIKASLAHINHDFPVDVSVTVTTNTVIQEINKKERGIDKPTDVLSFPMLFWKAPEVLETALSDYDFDMETGRVCIGDIILSSEKAKEQALEYGHTFEREICYLTLHGLLHLFGYDHMIEADKKIMRAKEKEIIPYF